jgi:hypothetical protein
MKTKCEIEKAVKKFAKTGKEKSQLELVAFIAGFDAGSEDMARYAKRAIKETLASARIFF